MKKKTLIFIGWALIIGSYFWQNDTYNMTVELAFAIVLGSAVVSLIFYPIYRWFFSPVSKTYTIKKGRHYSGFRLKPFFRCDSLEADVTFHDSCRYYEKGNNQLNEQVNKLFGFGAFLHHKNSHRIGWRYDKESGLIRLYTYNYFQGERFIREFDSCKIGQRKRIVCQSGKPYYFGFYLWPHFGGKAPAKQDTKITINFK